MSFPAAILAVVVTVLAADGADAADATGATGVTGAPRLTPSQVGELLAARAVGCAWRFVEAVETGRAPVERWRPLGCAVETVQNLRLARAPDGAASVTVLLPGTTRQPAAVQRAATLAVLAEAAPGRCRDRRIVDTLALGAATAVEHWTVLACGRRRVFRLAFEDTDGGAPHITLAPVTAGAP
ncbi:MAG: hypothetical protein GVY33_14885 [Alphaproteobacteria bacterium]|nr:hypothetical protein [Alphaproteobacteria bacterium]